MMFTYRSQANQLLSNTQMVRGFAHKKETYTDTIESV